MRRVAKVHRDVPSNRAIPGGAGGGLHPDGVALRGLPVRHGFDDVGVVDGGQDRVVHEPCAVRLEGCQAIPVPVDDH